MASNFQEVVLTSSPDGPVTGYDSLSGVISSEFTGSRSPRNGLCLVGKKLVAVSHVSAETGLGSVHLYNWYCKTPFHNLAVPEPVAPLAATRDGLYLFVGGLSGQTHTLSLPSGNLVQSFPAHRKAVSCLVINDDESLVLSGSDDGTITVIPLYNLISSSKRRKRDTILCRFVGHQGSVTSIYCGFGGGNYCTIMSSSLDSTCKIWSLMHGTHIRSIKFPCPMLSVLMDSTESEFYATGLDGVIYKGALKAPSRQAVEEARKIVPLKQKHYGPIVSIQMLSGGQNLVTASEDGNVWVWDIQSGQVVRILGHEMKIISSLVVAKVYNDPDSLVVTTKNTVGSGGFSTKELQRPIGEVVELKQRLKVAVQDRARSVTNLESAFGIYENLLKLVVKQAKGGKSDSEDDEDDESEEDEDEDEDETEDV